VALSMDEQRILDEMERNLAADDPRLASRLSAFGQQRLPPAFRSQRARTVSGVLALLLIAAVTVMMFVLSPYAMGKGARNTTKHSQPAPTASSTVKKPSAS
jgi:Protein of unknown function (DUF3040)